MLLSTEWTSYGLPYAVEAFLYAHARDLASQTQTRKLNKILFAWMEVDV